jgi:parvulin-like peptidyl-prolyl isomerase
MSTCLKIGNRSFNGDQLISALVQYKLLEPLIGQVMLDEVLQKVPITQQELFQAIAGSSNLELPEDFEGFLVQWCKQQGVTPAYFNEVMLRELRLEKFKQLRFANQVESEFLRTKSDLDRVEYSLIQLTDLALAQELYFQLRDDGTEFAQLAKQYSLGNASQTGGWIGPVPMSTLPVEIATLFRHGQVGTIYGPVPIADRFWIVRLEQLTVARLTEATRISLTNQLYTQWLQSQIKTLIATKGMIAIQAGTSGRSSISSSDETDETADQECDETPTETVIEG